MMKVDWIPARMKNDSTDSAGVVVRLEESGQQWKQTVVSPNGGFAEIERKYPSHLLEVYGDKSLHKMAELGLMEVMRVFDSYQVEGAFLLLQKMGYVPSPFSPSELFWKKSAGDEHVIASMILNGLWEMRRKGARLLPSGTVPENALVSIEADMQSIDMDDDQAVRELVLHILEFSGPIPMGKFRQYYGDSEEAFLNELYLLDEQSKILNAERARILSSILASDEEKESWNDTHWLGLDLLRVIDFMNATGHDYDYESRQWKRRT
jgi:hypothetical protein